MSRAVESARLSECFPAESAPASSQPAVPDLLYLANKHANLIPIKLYVRTVPPHRLIRFLETDKIFILFPSRSLKPKFSSNSKGGIVNGLLAELLRRRNESGIYYHI